MSGTGANASTRAGDSPPPDRRINPVAWGFAIAIVALAGSYAWALHTSARGCTLEFTWSGFHVHCEAGEPVQTAAASQAALAFPERRSPEGYVYYEAQDGQPTSDGALTLFAGQTAPAPGALQAGTILQATLDKRLRTRPTTHAGASVKYAAGTCFQLTGGPLDLAVPTTGGATGAYLPVKVVTCAGTPSLPVPAPTPTVASPTD